MRSLLLSQSSAQLLSLSKQGSTPTSWAWGLRDQIQKRCSRHRKPFVHRVYSAQRGIETMVSEGARPWGRGRFEFVKSATSSALACNKFDPMLHTVKNPKFVALKTFFWGQSFSSCRYRFFHESESTSVTETD